MLTPNPTFQGLIKIYQIPTKPKPKPYENTNFQEFRKVYGEKKVSYKCSQSSVSSVRPKTELKTIKLEMPVLGSEKAIVSVPVLKKNAAIKSILKKPSQNTVKVSSAQELVKKLSKMDKEQNNVKESPALSKTSSSNIIEKTNKEIEIAAVQLEEIRQMLQNKRQAHPNRKSSLIYKVGKKNSPRIRHADCFKTKYKSTLCSLKQKVQSLEEKYFSKPQIVYKSIHDKFTQSSDIKILYENKAFPEDLQIDQTLRGIIDELDDLVNIDIEEKLGSLRSEDEDGSSSPLKNKRNNQNEKLSSKKNFLHDKDEYSENLDNIFKFGRNKSRRKHFSKRKAIDTLDTELDDDSRRNCSPRNISLKQIQPTSSSSLTSTKSDTGKLTQRIKKKVTFVDTIPEHEPMSEPINTSNTQKCNLTMEKSECKEMLDKMYRESLSNFGEPAFKRDSIFSLLDDTQLQLDEFLKLKEEVDDIEERRGEKSSFLRTINDMNEFVKAKQRYDERKEVSDKWDAETLKIINRVKYFENDQKQSENMYSFRLGRYLQDCQETGTHKGTKDESESSEQEERNKYYSSRLGKIFEDSETMVSKEDLRADVTDVSKIEKVTEKDTKEEAIQIEDNICNVIDSSEALVKKFRDLKGHVLAVGEFCDNLSRITESEEEDEESKSHPKPISLHDGSGDERDSLELEEEDLPKSVKKSFYLMKEFNINPKVTIFSQSESVVCNKTKNREENCPSSSRSGVNMRNLKTNVNYAMENSIFSTLEY